MAGDAKLTCPQCGSTFEDDRVAFCPDDGSRLQRVTLSHDPLIGRTLVGRYKVIAPVGRGGMGTVYRAEQIAMQREIALKVLRSELAHDPAVQARFTREARSASQVESPHVVTLFDYGQTEDGLLYIAMELLKGQTLAAILKETGAIHWSEAARIGTDIARGLETAHEAGVVHRDLKPDNVHLGRGGSIKVLDFGIAKIITEHTALDQSGPVTIAGSILGTPAYMSPEAAARKGAVGKPTDVYALGVMLFQMVVGRPVFEEVEPVLLLGMHLRVDPELLREAAPKLELPDELEDLVDAMLAKDPDERPSAGEVAEALDALVKDPSGISFPLPAVRERRATGETTIEPGAATPVTSTSFTSETLARPPASRRWVLWAGIGVALAAVAGAVVVTGDLLAPDPEPTRPATSPEVAVAPEEPEVQVEPDPEPAIAPDAGPAVETEIAVVEPERDGRSTMRSSRRSMRRSMRQSEPAAEPMADSMADSMAMETETPMMSMRGGGLPLREDW